MDMAKLTVALCNWFAKASERKTKYTYRYMESEKEVVGEGFLHKNVRIKGMVENTAG